MNEIRLKSLLNIKAAQELQKKYYDVKHCKNKDKKQYKVGSLVLLFNSQKHSEKEMKMDPDWTGPYAIHEILSKHLVDRQVTFDCTL